MEIYQIKNIFPNETPDISKDVLFRNRKDSYKKLQALERNWGENYYIETLPLKIVSELDYSSDKLIWIIKNLQDENYKIYKNKSSAKKKLTDRNILLPCLIPFDINKKNLL